MFDSINVNEESPIGLMEAHELRLNVSSEHEGYVQLFYRDDCTVEGWYPRPVLPNASLSSTWTNFFKSSDPAQGDPVSLNHHPLTNERGRRQCWSYSVRFEGGAVEEFVLPCPPILLNLGRDQLIQELKHIHRQVFTENGFKGLQKGKDKVYELLRCRAYMDTFGGVWDDFFNDLPHSNDDPRYPLETDKCMLRSLLKRYMADVQVGRVLCYRCLLLITING